MSRVLAITFDGLLQPLGYSQVARVAMGLAARGFRYTVLSLERSEHLANAAHRQHVSEALAARGVQWAALPYANGGGGSAVLANVARATAAAQRLSARERFDLVHARAVHGGIVAHTLRMTRGVPYCFDARGYWVDEQVEEGRRFRRAPAYRLAKSLERRLFAHAGSIVTLTELQAADVRAGKLGEWRERPVVCIPTCADFGEFRPRSPGATRPDVLGRLPADARIIGIVGSLNRSYQVEETLRLARLVLERDPRWHLVVLSSQADEYWQAIDRSGIDRGRTLVASLPHHRMADVLPHLDWGLLLLRQNDAKRASMPTKLAEFLACGVRVVQFGCNDEVSMWVRNTDGGIVLGSLGHADLDLAARTIASHTDGAGARERARGAAATHFSLDSALERYARLHRELLASAPR